MIITTCGHTLPEFDFGNFIAYDSIDKYGNECKISCTVCDDCLEFYKVELKARLIEEK